MKSEICNPQYRSLLAAVIRAEPEARHMFKLLRRMGAKNLRPDYMLYPSTTKDGIVSYKRCIDLAAWNCSIRGNIHVAMIRHGENDWKLHG